jgi:hypothetical protein
VSGFKVGVTFDPLAIRHMWTWGDDEGPSKEAGFFIVECRTSSCEMSIFVAFIALPSLDSNILGSSIDSFFYYMIYFFFNLLYMVSHITTRGNRIILSMVTTRNEHIIIKFNQANSRRYARTFNIRMSKELHAISV